MDLEGWGEVRHLWSSVVLDAGGRWDMCGGEQVWGW